MTYAPMIRIIIMENIVSKSEQESVNEMRSNHACIYFAYNHTYGTRLALIRNTARLSVQMSCIYCAPHCATTAYLNLKRCSRKPNTPRKYSKKLIKPGRATPYTLRYRVLSSNSESAFRNYFIYI